MKAVAATIAFALALSAPAFGATGNIYRLAGTSSGNTGDNGAAINAQMVSPVDVLPFADGSYLIADSAGQRIRRVSPGGTITTVAGDSSVCPGGGAACGDGGAATAAQLRTVRGIEPAPGGDGFLLADTNNHRVRKVSAAGTITTIAGTGLVCSAGTNPCGDGGSATAAVLRSPADVSLTADGGYLIADGDAHRIRKVTAGGTITNVAGTGTQSFSGDGGPATAATLDGPSGVASTPDGGYLIADAGNRRVRRVSPGGTISTVAGTGAAGFSGDGGPATNAAVGPRQAQPSADGGFLIADQVNQRVRHVSPEGIISTVAGSGSAGNAGDGGAAVAAQLTGPQAAHPTPGGGFLIADQGNSRVRYVDSAIVAALPGPAGATGPAGFPAAGAPGANGGSGVNGGAGATGPAGRNGRSVSATCKVSTPRKGKKRTPSVTCTIKQVAASAARVRVRLSRGRAVLASGSAAVEGATVRLVLPMRRAKAARNCTLSVSIESEAGRSTTTQPLRLGGSS